MYLKKITILLFLTLFISQAHSESYKDQAHYETLTASNAAKALKWEIGLVAGSAIYLGLKNWN